MDTIDINCDVGEGVSNEKELFPYISSCSIACGGHTGDSSSMRETALLAKTHKVKVGAHPSYPDPDHFGRKSIPLDKETLTKSIQRQINALKEIVESIDVDLHHIKPHGALYHDIATNNIIAETFLNSIRDYKKVVSLFLPYGSNGLALAMKKGFNCFIEAFGDRRYDSDLRLVPRSLAGALITNPEEVLEQCSGIITKKRIDTITKKQKVISANTICIHGDNPKAFQILMYLSRELPNRNIILKK